jgi:hypothetical protein
VAPATVSAGWLWQMPSGECEQDCSDNRQNQRPRDDFETLFVAESIGTGILAKLHISVGSVHRAIGQLRGSDPL